MSISAEELGSITVDTWQTLLGLDPEQSSPRDPGDETLYCATVHVTGESQWTIRIDCSGEHALDAASAMFGTDPESTSADDISDALGELANVVAGNVKALLDGNARLSLPTVARGKSFEVKLPGMIEMHRLYFLCDGSPMSIAVSEQAGNQSTTNPTAVAASV